MATLYKLTDSRGKTKNETQWEVGKTVRIDPSIIGNELCTNQVLHAYKSPLVAELLNPIHGEYGLDKRLFECEGLVVVDDGIKVGVKSLKVIKEIQSIEINIIQRLAFGILCALEVKEYNSKGFIKWANNWLSGADRSIEAVVYTAYTAAYAAASAVTNTIYTAIAINVAYAAVYTINTFNTKPDLHIIALKAMEVN